MKNLNFDINIWNSINPQDRDDVTKTAGRLLKHGFLHQEAFDSATHITNAKRN